MSARPAVRCAAGASAGPEPSRCTTYRGGFAADLLQIQQIVMIDANGSCAEKTRRRTVWHLTRPVTSIRNLQKRPQRGNLASWRDVSQVNALW